jgi:hypothetical protein
VPSEAIVLHNASLFLAFGKCSRRGTLIVSIKKPDSVGGNVSHIQSPIEIKWDWRYSSSNS